MGTKLVTLAVVSTVMLLGASSAEAAKRKAKPSCAKKGSKTIVRAPGVRVYTVPGRREVRERLYGCLAAEGRKQLLTESALDDEGASSGFDDVRLAGHHVAWHSAASDLSCKAACEPGYNPTSQSVIAYDLKRRRMARRSIVAGYTDSSLALTQRGGLAWLSGTQLLAADSAGTRVLDTGTIAPSSVRAEISIVSWVRDGVERFARLR